MSTPIPHQTWKETFDDILVVIVVKRFQQQIVDELSKPKVYVRIPNTINPKCLITHYYYNQFLFIPMQ
jgi:hypothetical protein